VAMKQNKTKNAKQTNILLLAIVLILLAGLAAGFFLVQSRINQEAIPDAGEAPHADLSSRFITHDGKQYRIRQNLSSILLIGFDSFEEDTDRIVEGKNRNRDLSDFIVVLLVDHKNKTITPLQLNRDTLCEIPWLDETGAVGGYHTEQLAFAHTYGSGGEDSARNTVRAVRMLLYNAPIQDYVVFSMDTVPILNDLVGGVTLTLSEDLTAINPAYTKGSRITLEGNKALHFLRYRENTGGSNWYRMRRHRQYLTAFFESTERAIREDPDLATKAYSKVSPYLCTSMTVNNITELVDQISEYSLNETLAPGGTAVPGEKFYEFHVDEQSLWDCVYKAYCQTSDKRDH